MIHCILTIVITIKGVKVLVLKAKLKVFYALRGMEY